MYKIKSLITACLTFFCSTCFAVEITSITAFGDSTFDGGSEETAVISAYKLGLGSAVLNGYKNFKSTNGYTTPEYLAYYNQMYNKQQFFNYGVKGITSTNLRWGLNDYLNRNLIKIDPQGLYIIFAGGNDILQRTTPADATFTDSVSNNIVDMVKDLKSRGANYFMVLGLPQIGQFPTLNKPSDSATQRQLVNAACNEINQKVKDKIKLLSYANQVIIYDIQTLRDDMVGNPQKYGMTNLKDACYSSATTNYCSNFNEYFFWDEVHLTDRAHSNLGYNLKQLLDSAKVKW